MASRRDELNAYSFARKRTVASFLKPLPNGSTESAPRPVRTVVPTIVTGALILVGFGACGIVKPAAPQGWDKPGEKVIVGDTSTTRYVVLESTEEDGNGQETKRLHPVLNLASARLLLDPAKFEVVKVKESVLDGAEAPPRGPTIGIPYAPDRLPSADDAGTEKTWALCEQPGEAEGTNTQRAVFVLNERDAHRGKLTETRRGRVSRSQALYVQDPDGVQYLVDHRGVAHELDATWAAERAGQQVDATQEEHQQDLLRSILFAQAEPQEVSEEWMATLNRSPLPIFLPTMPDAGAESAAAGAPPAHRTVGKVLEADGKYFVVERDRVAPVSEFVAKLLLEGNVGLAAYRGSDPEAVPLGLASIRAEGPEYLGEVGGKEVPWPKQRVARANTSDEQGGDDVVCSVYYGGNRKVAGADSGIRDMSTWAGGSYPAPIADGSSAYVSPGSGLLYRQVTGGAEDGPLFLVTDTGLRYSVQVNNDSATSSGNAEEEQNQAQVRLGYGEVSSPPLVPKEWSQLLSAGPSLNTDAAKQPQGS